MKGKTGIWIDGKKAIIVHLFDHTDVVDILESEVVYRQRFPGEGKAFTRLGEYYISNEEKEEERVHHERRHYLEAVVAKLDADCDIVVFGPAQTKQELLKAMQKRPEFASKLITLKPADDMTVNQFKEKVREYFEQVVA